MGINRLFAGDGKVFDGNADSKMLIYARQNELNYYVHDIHVIIWYELSLIYSKHNIQADVTNMFTPRFLFND